MARNIGSDNKTALEAKYEAQKIAFAPLMFQAALALRDFGILELLLKSKKAGLRMEDIAQKAGLSEYSTTVLLEAGLSMELVLLVNDHYLLTKTGFYISNDELTRVNMNFTNDINYQGAYYLKDSLVSGEPEGLHKTFGKWNTIYEALSELPEKARSSWFEFDHYYSNLAFDEILPLVFAANPSRILDIGGNTGLFAIACAGYDKNVKITILDLPGQLKVAGQNISKNSYTDRIGLYPINLLEEQMAFPDSADTIWMSQLLDCFSEEEIVTILQRAADKMGSSTELFIMETFWEDQKYKASTYSLHATSLYFACMANGNSRMYHSDDMRKLVEKSGMLVVKQYSNIGVSHTLFKCKLK